MWALLREAMWSGCSHFSRSVCFHPNLTMRALRSEDLRRLWVLEESSLLPFPPRNGTVWGTTYESGSGCVHTTKWVIWFWNNEEWFSAGYKPHCSRLQQVFPASWEDIERKFPYIPPSPSYNGGNQGYTATRSHTMMWGKGEEKIPTCWLYVVCTEYTNNHQFRTYKKGFMRLRMKSQDKDL